ncbi:hypothetical protein F9288_13490 [Sphingomonas sp. CL5.1]|uniref:aspartate/glutamate racemase family protein n=1 Tax=Sphingomonas sp. CL5.1 TaxID=2653203 RepID=UPI001582F112|nr:aspartate/glutamate racemase family protein [Sphingomonas sp. CL5.1]QKS00519.1 hypothetical protein F9288_13490 [Sphingomonas sp. CL5.1]
MADLGVIVANSSVPRVPGEIGDAASMPEGTLYEAIAFQDFLREMREGLLPSSLDALLRARDILVACGARCIATSCGMLWPWQARLEADSPVPFVSSALCLLDHLRAQYPGGVGVVSVELGFLPLWRRTFGERIEGVAFHGLGGDHYLYRALTGAVPCDAFSPDIARVEILRAITDFVARSPSMEAIILECTNLSPYRDTIADAVRLPVHDIFSAIDHASSGVA